MENKHKKLLDDLLMIIEKEGASDLHISEGRYPTIRVDGSLVPVTIGNPMTGEDIEEMLRIFLPPESREKFMVDKEFDFS
jgi:twitching motility protein PilT